MKMWSGIRGSRTRSSIILVLFSAYLSAPRGLLNAHPVLAQSSQPNSAGKPDTLPGLTPNIATNAPTTNATASKAPVPAPPTPNPAKDKRTPVRFLGDRLPDKPSLAPTFIIPVGPLGFTAPGPRYLGARNSLASLGFLGEDHLLFTFRVPGLIRREAPHQTGDNERQIQAVVVEVKTGRVEAEALWTVHDLVRYLWMLNDGHFLLRDRDGLEVGDSSLVLKPLLQFPGEVQWLEMDPEQRYMVTNSIEPTNAASKPGQVDSTTTAAASIQVDGQNPSAPADTVVRILERSTGKVMLVSRVHSTVHLPINADGYLERLRSNGQTWLLNLNYFTGGSHLLGRVESYCSPVFDFISQSEFLVTACNTSGGNRLVAFATDGRRLWEEASAGSEVWPITTMSPDGSRLAFETLAVTRPVNAFNPLDSGDVKAQLVRIINAADGNIALEAAATPPLDAGGNVAFSPSGKRAAILIDGSIQVFDLPPAPAAPGPPPAPPAR